MVTTVLGYVLRTVYVIEIETAYTSSNAKEKKLMIFFNYKASGNI